jgi:hypothetical protein
MRGKWVSIAFFAAALVVFFFANRAAYKGYFSDDDLDNLGWPTIAGEDTFVTAILTPRFSETNLRPIGDLYYRYLGRAYKLRFPPYVFVLQLLHVLNAVLLFCLLRRLDFSNVAAGAGALFYGLNAVILEACWKPMYIFDVLCATFCLTALLLYLRGRWIMAIVPFWLAYKSKEIVVMLPVALLAYEWLLGERKWKRLIPYFLISLSFGLQALWANRLLPQSNQYSLQFSPGVLWHSIAFYSSAIFLVPFAGLALLLLPLLVRDKRLYLGIVFMAAAFVPMLVLPARLAGVYWYIPLIGVAIAAAAIASRTPQWALALFFVLWLPLNYLMVRDKRREILALADENRWFTEGLVQYARRIPPVKGVVYRDVPEHMHSWGAEGAIHQVFGSGVDAVWYLNPEAKRVMANVPMAVVSYYPVPPAVKGMLRARDGLQSYLRCSDYVPKPQLGDGWYDNSGDVCRVKPSAELTLYRPDDAREFEIKLQGPGLSNVTVFEDGVSLGTLSRSDPQPLRWKLAPGTSGDKHIKILSEPAGAAGIAISSLGYEP